MSTQRQQVEPSARPPSDARVRLEQAAVAAFATRGFHGTTTRDIAAAAGMSPAALYVHHRSKEELLHRISHVGHEVFLALVDDAIAAHPDPVGRLRALIHATVRHHAIHHTSARVTNYELAALAEDHHEAVLDLRHRIDSRVHDVIEAGVADGVLHTSSARMSTVLVLSMIVDVTRWYDESGDWDPDELADFYADQVLAMLGAGPPA